MSSISPQSRSYSDDPAKISISNQKQQDSKNPAQQFCLRWNNYQTNLTSVFDQLLQSESFVDVTLACDGHSIKAHKMVLSACSPYFQNLFFDNPCQHPIIIMRDVKWPELKAVVEFMYKGEINVSQDQIGPLLKVAEMLKIRGLAEVNSEQDLQGQVPQQQQSHQQQHMQSMDQQTMEAAAKEQPQKKRAKEARDWEAEIPPSSTPKSRKRRWPSGERSSSIGSPIDCTPENLEVTSPLPQQQQQQHSQHPPSTPTPIPQNFPMASQLDPIVLGPLSMNHPDEMEIKPGIAEMIREEERAKLLENSQAWLGASSSSIAADSYQYQLQSMWQKCWNSQNLIHHLRFRERGPLKSWRPETMAEAIFSVLKEGLSLSQAARKFDIPYPTFVLYANRVHNMLGPSIDGGTDLRPKGRGRPQRILLGIWPDDHIKGVIKSVVFRDAKDLKDEQIHMYGRHSPFPFQDGPLGYPANTNGLGQVPGSGGSDSMSPDAVSAAISAVRQQMCNMVAAAQHHPDAAAAANMMTGFNLPGHLSVHPHTTGGGGGAGGGTGVIPIPKLGSPANLNPINNNGGTGGGLPAPRLGSPAVSHHSLINMHAPHAPPTSNPSSSIINSTTQSHSHPITTGALSITRISSPVPHDLRMASPDDSPSDSPLSMVLEPAVNLAVGDHFKSSKSSTPAASQSPEQRPPSSSPPARKSASASLDKHLRNKIQRGCVLL